MSISISSADSSSYLTSLLSSLNSSLSSSASSSSSSTTATDLTDAVSDVEQVKAIASQGGFEAFLQSSIGAAVVAQSMGTAGSATTADTAYNLADGVKNEALAAYKLQQSDSTSDTGSDSTAV